MTNKAVIILKEKVPTALMKAYTKLVAKEVYSDGDITELYERVKNSYDMEITERQKKEKIVEVANFYQLGEQDRELVKEIQEIMKKEDIRNERLQKELQENTVEQDKVQHCIEQEDKEGLKELFKDRKEMRIPLVERLQKNRTKKAFILEAIFESYEEGVIRKIPIEVVEQMRTTKEKKELNRMLKSRTDYFQESLKLMEKARQLVEECITFNNRLIVNELNEETYSEIILSQRLNDSLKNSATTLLAFFKEGNLENKDFEIDRAAQEEIELGYFIEHAEEFYIVNRIEQKLHVWTVLKQIMKALSRKSLDFVQFEDADEKVFEVLRQIKKHLFEMEENIGKAMRIKENLEMALVFDPKKKRTEHEKQKTLLKLLLKKEIYTTTRIFEKAINSLMGKERTIKNKEELLNRLNRINDGVEPDKIFNYFFVREAEEIKELGITLTKKEKEELLFGLLEE